jgi:hypothetical protein
MTDPLQDQAGALYERDIVGDVGAPAGLRAADSQYLYLRFRLDRDPAPGGTPRPYTWGILVDTDGDPSTYEVLLLADGISGMVSVYRHPSGTPGNASDPPQQPPVESASWSTRARTAVAPGSSYDGDADYFLDFAVPWSVLRSVGLDHVTPIHMWEATSSVDTGMNSDFACNTAIPVLDGKEPLTAADPNMDTDGDGYSNAYELQNGTNPNDPNSHPGGPGDVPKLAGGACGGNALASVLPAAVITGWLRRRRRASTDTGWR